MAVNMWHNKTEAVVHDRNMIGSVCSALSTSEGEVARIAHLAFTFIEMLV